MASYFLYQATGTPSASVIPPNVVQVYANNSGVLLSRASGQSPVVVGTAFTGALQAANTVFTGITMGGVATNTGIWIPITLSGVNYAIPAFRYI